MANSSTSLYSFTNNVTVSSNNVTTLYNSNPTQVTTGNVADRNFTTLYTQQTEIAPTRSYSNSNVESFLNAGFDSAGNEVANIVMQGNLTVGQQSNLGDVGNVHIDGGTLNYILQTDGAGHLSWTNIPDNRGNVVPYIHFDVVSNGNSQSFTNGNLSNYPSNTQMNVMKNGVNIEPSQYTVSGSTLIVNIPLTTGDTIDVLASSAGSNLHASGNLGDVQYNNGGNGFQGNINFNYDQGNGVLRVGNINVSSRVNTVDSVNTGNAVIFGNLVVQTNTQVANLTVSQTTNLGSVGNLHITGGSPNYVLQTDGSGSLSWVAQVGTGGNANFANFAGTAYALTSNLSNVHISGGANGQFLKTNGSNVLSWGDAITNPGGVTTQVQYNQSGNLVGATGLTYTIANSVTTANNLSVTGSANISNIQNLLSGTEVATTVSSFTSTYSFDVTTTSIVLVTGSATANFVINFINLSTIPTNQFRTFTFINKNGVGLSYLCTGIQNNGTPLTTNWLGGSSPVVGNPYDMYTFNIFNTGSGYTVFGAQGGF